MSEPAQAVFLSYASQDVVAALRICVALRAAGIEVWFDQPRNGNFTTKTQRHREEKRRKST